MEKKTVTDTNPQFQDKRTESGKVERRIKQTRTFDDLCKGECYVVKEGADSYELKPIPQAAPKETPKHFQPGDKVKNQYGKLLTVLVQLGSLVIVKEEANNYHPRDLTMIERATDTYQI